ncbi:hypothetical protein [Actinorugispora endophytica]|nr:hypothetical protein [Actinorugispora endophytica]
MAAVLVTSDPPGACPPGVDPAVFSLALAEDVYEVVAGLELCEAAFAVDGDAELAERIAELTWPGTPVRTVRGPSPLRDAFGMLAGQGARQAVVLAADAPDLPPLLVGKLFRALGTAEAAACPAFGGGLVALAARLPLPDWIGAASLDDPDALGALTAARPARRALVAVPGWHRLRDPRDLAALDPGLEGWEATRMLLSARGGTGRAPHGSGSSGGG